LNRRDVHATIFELFAGSVRKIKQDDFEIKYYAERLGIHRFRIFVGNHAETISISFRMTKIPKTTHESHRSSLLVFETRANRLSPLLLLPKIGATIPATSLQLLLSPHYDLPFRHLANFRLSPLFRDEQKFRYTRLSVWGDYLL
jgi:hypothetical protein